MIRLERPNWVESGRSAGRKARIAEQETDARPNGGLYARAELKEIPSAACLKPHHVHARMGDACHLSLLWGGSFFLTGIPGRIRASRAIARQPLPPEFYQGREI